MGTKGFFLFSQRASEIDVAGRLARLVNLTTPNMLLHGEERRSDTRANRSLPVLLAPWENDEPVVEETTVAITKDLGGTGVSVLLRQPLRMDALVLGFWMPDEPGNPVDGSPLFVRAHVVTNTPLGGGFWQCGLEVDEILLETDYPQLEKLAPRMQQMAPPRRALDADDNLPEI